MHYKFQDCTANLMHSKFKDKILNHKLPDKTRLTQRALRFLEKNL